MRLILLFFAGLAVPAAFLSAGEVLQDGAFASERIGNSGFDVFNSGQWVPFTSAEPMLVKVARAPLSKEGKALRIESHGQPGAYQGFFQSVAVKSGRKYTFSVRVLNDPDAPLRPGSFGLLSVEWKDAGGQEIKRDEERLWDRDLSVLTWTVRKMTVTAPPDSSEAHFVVLQKDDEAASSTGGAFYVSLVSVVQQ